MARSRNIKPGFFTNEVLGECSFPARLCFAGLWTLADREGRLEDRPKRIKGELFRFDSIEVDALLAELAQQGFILRYPAAGQRFIQVVEFLKHQHPHNKEPDSVIPSPESLGFSPHGTPSESETLPTALEPKTETLPPSNSDPSSESRVMPGLDPPCKGGEPGCIPHTESGELIPDSGIRTETAKTPKLEKKSRALPDDLTTKDLTAEGVDAEVAADWLRIRRGKKAPLTPTAWAGVKREAAAAGMTPAQAVKLAAENDWRGFKAAWVHDSKPGPHVNGSNPPTSWHETAGGVKAKGWELGIPYTSADDCKPFPEYKARVLRAARQEH